MPFDIPYNIPILGDFLVSVTSLGTANLVIILAIFVVFLVVMKKVIKTIFNMVWIAAASAVFPFLLGFLGFNVPMDLNSVIFFVIIGLGIYFVYLFGKIVYTALGLAEKVGRTITYPLRGKDKEKKKMDKMEKYIEEQEEKEKEEEEEK